MNPEIRYHLDTIKGKDKTLRYDSYQFLINATKEKVNWAYEVWNELLDMAQNGDNHQRTIAVQLLSALAKSDTKNKLQHDLPILITVTHDEKFVTVRHSLQSLWKIGIANAQLKELITEELCKRFIASETEKNCTLIRYDIIEVFRKMYNVLHDAGTKDTALSLIDMETDLKYRKKYLSLWKDLVKKP
jgi:hypothetical protein